MDSTFSRSCLLRVLTNYTLLLYHIKSTAPVHSQQEIRPPKVFRSGFFWGDKFSIFRFPCQTLTSNFDSYLQYLEIARLSYSMFEYYCYLYIYFFFIFMIVDFLMANLFFFLPDLTNLSSEELIGRLQEQLNDEHQQVIQVNTSIVNG